MLSTPDPIQLIREAVAAPSETDRQAQQQAEKVIQQLASCLISVHSTFPPRQGTVSLHDVSFFEKGDIHAVKAKQKQGKSTALQIIVAAVLGGQRFALQQAPLVTAEGETSTLFCPRVSYYDTEQKPQDVKEAYLRILQLAGLPEEDIHDRLSIYSLRSIDEANLADTLEQHIRQTHPDLVILDGIVDIEPAFNDEAQSQQFISRLTRLATETDSAIVCVLHTNKDRDDDNMRGHLGTMLAQKAGNVIECKRDGKIFRVINADSRHLPMPDWSFMYNDAGELIDADAELERQHAEYCERQQAKRAAQREEIQQKRIQTALQLLTEHPALHRRIFRQQLMERLDLGETTIKELIHAMQEAGQIQVVNDRIYPATNTQTTLFTE